MDDLDALILKLDGQAKHWRLQCVNCNVSTGKETTESDPERLRRYECTVWAYGKRFTVNRGTPLLAVKAAIDRMEGRDQKGKALRLVS